MVSLSCQKYLLRSVILAFLGLVLILCSFQKLEGRQRVVSSPAVLFMGARNSCDHVFARRLVRDGIEVNSRADSLDESALGWDEVKDYNVLVVAGLGLANADGSMTGRDLKTIAVIRRFVNEGGGIFYVPSWLQMDSLIPPQRELLKPWGMEPLFEEMVFDHQATVRATPWKIDFSFANSIIDSPMTTGVEGLWVPVATRAGMQAHLVPFLANEAWQIDVAGARSTFSRTVPGDQLTPGNQERGGRFAERVPVIASRELDHGRVVVCAIRGQDWIWGPYAVSTLEGVTLDAGLNGKASGGYQMVLNSIRWLAEPSLGRGKLGGAETHPRQLENPFKPKPAPLTDWKKLEHYSFPYEEMTWPGVIGAKSQFSGGRGTVEDWVREAKKAGLKYLVFLEDFAELTEEELKKLQDICAAHTTKDFAALPGFHIRDEIGNSYFYAGPKLRYPPAEILSDDGRVFISFDAQLNAREPRSVRGQLSHTTLRYTYQFCGFRMMAGNFLFEQDAAPVADWFANYQAVGVITRQGGKLIEDAVSGYLELVESGQGPLPMVIDLIDDPSELAATPWRTVLRLSAAGKGSPGKGADVNPVSDYFGQWHFFPDNPSQIFISNGPQIDYWSHLGRTDYEGANPNGFVWENLRWKVGGKVRSAAGLKEVIVYDGTRIFRRFKPGGVSEFEFTLDLTHDRQHNLVLVVTDLYGRRAVSAERWDRNHRLQEVMCADRNNQLTYGYTIRQSDGTGLLLGGNGALSTPNKRIIDRAISPSGAFKNDPFLGAAAFDGATSDDPEVVTSVSMHTTALKTVVAPRVGKSSRLLHTGDVNIGEGMCGYRFADGVREHNVWHSLWRTEKSKDLVVTQRNHLFQIDPDSPLAVSLIRLQVRLVADFPDGEVLKVAMIYPKESRTWAVRGTDGSTIQGNFKKAPEEAPHTHLLPFGVGAYAAALDSPLGGCAVIPLDEGLSVRWSTPQPKRINIVLLGEAVPRKSGEMSEVSFLLIGIPRSTKYTQEMEVRSPRVVERFCRDFGLGPGPAEYTVEAKTGRVMSQRYPLRIDGSGTQGFSGVIGGRLMTTLPVLVEGLNDRWSAFLYDRNLKAARPLGVFENKAWATVKVEEESDLFIGHPVSCENKEVVLQLTQTAASRWVLEVHNPTEKAIETRVRIHPDFDPLKGKSLPSELVSLPPGVSVRFEL